MVYFRAPSWEHWGFNKVAGGFNPPVFVCFEVVATLVGSGLQTPTCLKVLIRQRMEQIRVIQNVATICQPRLGNSPPFNHLPGLFNGPNYVQSSKIFPSAILHVSCAAQNGLHHRIRIALCHASCSWTLLPCHHQDFSPETTSGVTFYRL